MDNSTQQEPANRNFSPESAVEETDGQTEQPCVKDKGDDLNGTDLFSLFTADIIRQKVLFAR